MAEWNPRANDLFLRAAEIDSPTERGAFLDRECGEPGLREQVESLLGASDKIGSFLGQPAIAPHRALEATAAYEPINEGPGTVIGPYKLLEQIGEGGFGVVFMAEQTRPVRRKVALKILKPGMDTRQVVARFEAERQALAIMDHPNIAKVLDGGATASGRPYFVMELVKGVPITEHCDQNHLTPRERLELFVSVCHAVQHAHQKGIIHRDLKPSNVLVTMHDTTPLVKVIDFGVAKALGQELTDKTLFTAFAQMIGTPLYMSPEQAGQSSLDIDTRSDIYSLGVLLYELLTGTTPFDKHRFKQAAYDEIRRIIREEEPPKPSTRLSELSSPLAPREESGGAKPPTSSLASVAALRHTEPAKLTKLIRGELDWIVMKALEKDRNRRYETANGFAMDVQRYLVDEPVLAGPPSPGYRLKKFLRRNRRSVLAAAVLLLAFVVGITGTSFGLVRALRAERVAGERLVQVQQANRQTENALEETKQAKAATEHALEESEQARQRAQAVSQYIVNAFRSPDPALDGRAIKVADVLDRALAQLDNDLPDQPLTRASLLDAIGQTYRGLGLLDRAVEVFEQAVRLREHHLGADHPETLTSTNNLAEAYNAAGQLDKALPLFEQTLQRRQEKLGPDHPNTLTSMNNLAAGYYATGQLDKALPLLEELLKQSQQKLGPNHYLTLAPMNNLAECYRVAGQLDKALPLLNKTLRLLKETLGPDDPDTLQSANNLALGYKDASQLDKALPLFEETLERRQEKLGPDHPDTLMSMNNLAVGYKAAGQLDKALSLYEETLERRQEKLGPDHPDTLHSMNNLAMAYMGYHDLGQLDKAIPLLEETLKRRQQKLGPDNPDTLLSMNNLAMGYRAAGQLDRALPLLEETLNRRRQKLGPDHPHTLVSMNNLAMGYGSAYQLNKALPLYEETLKRREEKLGPDHPDTFVSMNNLALGYKAAGLLNKAVPLLEETLKRRQKKQGPDHPDTLLSMNNLASAYRWAGQLDQARSLLRECLERLQQSRPEDWWTFQTQVQLGTVLSKLKQFDQAEPLLVAGYEGIAARIEIIPAPERHRLKQAVEEIVNLYESWGKPDEAAKWRGKLPKPESASGKQKPENK